MEPVQPAEPRPTRRSLLRGAAATGALGVATPLLASCGSDQPSARSSGGGTSPGQTSPGQAPPASTGGSTGGSAVLGPAAQVPVGGGKIYANEKVVVTQPAKGTFKAFSAICTHQGCPVGSVSAGTINCPCHGSRFDVATGKPVAGPAAAPLPSVDVKIDGGEITLT
jgi:Rieske Fe-S protein